MSWRVTIRDAAKTDLREARDWYEAQRSKLGDEFLMTIAESLLALEETPLRWPIYYRGFRKLLTDRFPYKLFYRIDGDVVVVFRILHAARDHERELLK